MISGYHARLNATALGLTFEALVFVTMRGADRDTVDAFEQAVATIPNVVQAQRLFGDPDYLLRVVTRDLPDFQRLYDDRLTHPARRAAAHSTLVMKSIVENRPSRSDHAELDTHIKSLLCVIDAEAPPVSVRSRTRVARGPTLRSGTQPSRVSPLRLAGWNAIPRLPQRLVVEG